MKKFEAILVMAQATLALFPLVMLTCKEESAPYANLFGVCWLVLLVAYGFSSKGRKFVRRLENAHNALWGDLA